MTDDRRPILSVEDSDEDFFSLCEALKAAGIQNPVERCADGRTAHEALASAAGCEKARQAAFVLLDLNLPGADGRDLLEAFRKREPSVPVLVLSTSSHPADVERCYRAGANAYLVKPLELDRWQEMIKAAATFWLRAVEPPPRRN